MAISIDLYISNIVELFVNLAICGQRWMMLTNVIVCTQMIVLIYQMLTTTIDVGTQSKLQIQNQFLADLNPALGLPCTCVYATILS